MAEIEEKIVLTVDTGNSQKTVKGLKEEIASLKDTILNLDKGTDEYHDAVQKLQADQRQLNEIMALTKKEAVALDGSYDALTHQMALLKKEWKATNDEVKRAEIGKQIGEINTQLKELDAEIGNYQRNVGNYVSQWEGVPDTVKDFGTAMREANETIEPTKQGLEGLGNLASGLASGFAAVQGAAALLGVENEKLEQTFIKLQAAMALAQGISGMKGLVEGASKLSAVIGVSVKTLGLWGAAIAAVAAGFYALLSNLPSVKKQQAAWDAQIENSIRGQEEYQASVQRANEALNDRVDILKAQGVAEKEILERQIAQAKASKDSAWSELMKAQNKYLKVKSDAEGPNAMTRGAFKYVYGMSKDEALKHYKDLEDSAKEFYRTQAEAYDEFIHQMEVLNEKEKTAFANKLKGYADALKSEEERLKEQYEKDLKMAEQYGFDTLQIVKKYEADLKAIREKNKMSTVLPALDDIEIEDEPIKVEDEPIKLQEEGEYYGRLKAAMAAIDKTYSDLARKNGEDEAEYLVTIEERKLARMQELHQQAKEAGDYESQILLAQEIADQEIAVEEAKNAELERMQQESLDAKKEKLDAWMGYLDNASTGLETVGKVMDAVYQNMYANAQKDGEISEEEAKKLKGVQKAQAWISALSGAVQAFAGAMQLGPIAGPIIGGINAAAVLAMGAANVKQIESTNLAGSVSTSTTTITPHTSSYQSDLPFSYTKQVTGAQETEQLNQSQNIQVWIAESDIQASNNRVQTRIAESSF